VHDLLAAGKQIVRDNPAMASPPDGFCTHDRAAVSVTQFKESLEANGVVSA
jgi:hypothetical protein